MNTDKQLFPRHTCQMPGCSIEINGDKKYCKACEWMKDREMTVVTE